MAIHNPPDSTGGTQRRSPRWLGAIQRPAEEDPMHGIIYIIGLVVVVLAVINLIQ